MESRMPPMNLLSTEKMVTEIGLLLQQAIVGYRFHPTEEELVNYLRSQVTGCRETFCIIPRLEKNIYEINPWDLPAKFNENSIIRSRDQEWWFICPQMQNQRISRKTPCGSSWKITGKHKDIKAKNDDNKIGSKITLVFLDSQKSKGTRSGWVMHEFHTHPDDTGFVLCCLKMKQDEKADDQEPSVITENSSGRGLTVSDPTNDGLNFPLPFHDVCSATEAEKEKVNQFSAQEKADVFHSVKEMVDEMSGTSNFIGEQAARIWDNMDCENPNQLHPFTEHRFQQFQNQLNDHIMNGTPWSTEISSSNNVTLTNEWSWNELMVSPLAHGSISIGQLSDLHDLISESEADMGVIQDVQHGETSLDNYWAKQNQRPVCDTLEGVVPLEEEEEFVEQKLNHPQDTEKIITEYTSSDGAPAKVKASATEFKEKETTLLQPKKKKDDVKIESETISHWETWMESPSPRRSTASPSCCCRNEPTIDIRVYLYLAMLLAFAFMVCTIVDGICRISDDVNETIQHFVFYRRF